MKASAVDVFAAPQPHPVGRHPSSDLRRQSLAIEIREWVGKNDWRDRSTVVQTNSGFRQGRQRQRRPLAVSVNRTNALLRPVHAFFSLQSTVFQPTRDHCTLGSRTLVAPEAHQSPIRIKACTPRGAWPLAAFAAPENPLFPTASIPRSRPCQPHSSVASPVGDPTPCGSRYGRNELINMGGIGAGVQSALVVLPTYAQHCRRRPIDRLCSHPSHPKAFAVSNGVPSLITW
jgi:hypothetical protein